MENDDLVNVVTQLYQAVAGQKPAAETSDRLRIGVEAALKIKEADADLFYGLVTIGLVEAKNKLGLSEESCVYADRLVRYYAGKSSYMETPQK